MDEEASRHWTASGALAYSRSALCKMGKMDHSVAGLCRMTTWEWAWAAAFARVLEDLQLATNLYGKSEKSSQFEISWNFSALTIGPLSGCFSLSRATRASRSRSFRKVFSTSFSLVVYGRVRGACKRRARFCQVILHGERQNKKIILKFRRQIESWAFLFLGGFKKWIVARAANRKGKSLWVLVAEKNKFPSLPTCVFVNGEGPDLVLVPPLGRRTKKDLKISSGNKTKFCGKDNADVTRLVIGG